MPPRDSAAAAQSLALGSLTRLLRVQNAEVQLACNEMPSPGATSLLMDATSRRRTSPPLGASSLLFPAKSPRQRCQGPVTSLERCLF